MHETRALHALAHLHGAPPRRGRDRSWHAFEHPRAMRLLGRDAPGRAHGQPVRGVHAGGARAARGGAQAGVVRAPPAFGDRCRGVAETCRGRPGRAAGRRSPVI